MFDAAAVLPENTPGSYCQTLSTGHFFILLYLVGPDEEVNLEFGRRVLGKIEEITAQTPSITPAEIIEMQKDEFEDGAKVNLGIGKVKDQVLTVSVHGEIKAKIIRAGKIINLFNHDSASAVVSISGPVLQNDLVILGTGRFFAEVKLHSLIVEGKIAAAEARELLVPQLEAAAEKNGQAGLIISLDLTELPVEEEAAMTEEVVLPPRESPIISKSFSFPRFWTARDLREQKLRVASILEPGNKRSLYLIILVLVLLVSFVSYQLRSRGLEQQMSSARTIAAEVNDSITSAKKLAGLNDTLARQMLLSTKSDVETKTVALFGRDWQTKKSPETTLLSQTMAQLEDNINQVSHVQNVAKMDLFYDFSLLKSGVKIISANEHSGFIAAVDGNNGAIYTLGTKNKTAAIAAGGEELRNAQWAAVTDSYVYIWTPGGIYQKKLSDSQAKATQIIKPSDKWGRILGLGAFAGNLYLLDSQNTMIWKYQGTDLGFADITNYLGHGLSLDFSNVNSLAIDGFVYVLTNTGNLVQFSGGSPLEFKESGLIDNFSQTPTFFVSDETQSIYVYDKANQEVVLLDKKGNYVGEYKLGPDAQKQISVTPLLLADESVKKVFLISGDKAYSFDLR